MPQRSVLRMLADAALSVAALAGVVCLILVPLAWFFDISIVMFRTGSMAPTINPGDIAIVREIPAEEIAVGDIVTVDRDGALPVTHRVTSVAEGEQPGERVLTMRGDANEADDPHPYVVQHGRLVLFPVPGLAPAIAFLSDSRVLGVTTIVMSVVVGWAFWPRGPVAERPEQQGTVAGAESPPSSAL